MFQKEIEALDQCKVEVVKFGYVRHVYLDLYDENGKQTFVALLPEQVKKLRKALKAAVEHE